jgi:L-aspartate-alpha-decarboxylase
VQRIMLKSKIHRATLTATDLHYEGSIGIDTNLLKAADILPGEQVHVLNLNNGNRLVTYAIEAAAGSGTIMLNGPAARCGMPGDVVVIIAYANLNNDEASVFKPNILLVDEQNKIKQ